MFINEIKSSSAQLLKLINDILFLSRLDAEMITINPQPIDFATSIAARCEHVWANQRKPGVSYIVKAPFKKLVVDIDMNNISMVMEKILTNAVQHTEEGTVLVHYDYLGDQLAVSVEDTGHGIPEDQMKILVDKMPGQKNDCPFSEKPADSIGYFCVLKKRKTRGPFACTREQCPYLKPMFERKVKTNDH